MSHVGVVTLDKARPVRATSNESEAFRIPPRELATYLECRARQHGLDVEEHWLLAVSLGSLGRYADALTHLGWPTIPTDEKYTSQWFSTAASFHRQVGRHREARDLDARALACAVLDHDRCDALVGLTADAVGLADVVAAREHYPLAVKFARDDWRRRARCAWVHAEFNLLVDDPRSAMSSAREALSLSEIAQAPRHRVKSELILGVAQMTVGEPEASRRLQSSLSAARALGVWSLAWPAASVLANVHPDRSDDLRREVRVITSAIGFCLPVAWRRDWNAVHRHAR